MREIIDIENETTEQQQATPINIASEEKPKAGVVVTEKENQVAKKDEKPQRTFEEIMMEGVLLYIKDNIKAQKIVASVFTTINTNEALSKCDKKSVVHCVKDALSLGLTIDKNQFCWLIPYGGKATLQIGYKGYINKVIQIFPGAKINVGLVYEGDELTISENSKDFASYELKVKNPFESDITKLQGAYCFIEIGNKGYIEVIGKKELETIKGKAKSKDVWNAWYGEMAKKSVIKRACKLHFAQDIADLEEYDNEQYDLKQPKTDGLDKLNDENKMAIKN